MVLCLLSRDSHGDTGKLNHEETVRGPEIAISPEKSEIVLLILVKILKKSDSTHSSFKSTRSTPRASTSERPARGAVLYTGLSRPCIEHKGPPSTKNMHKRRP